MAKSTQVITDLKTANTTALSAAAKLAAITASNLVQDPSGNINAALVKAEELLIILNQLVFGPDGSTVANAIITTGGDSAVFTALDSVRQVLV
jgi:hypothetical protein